MPDDERVTLEAHYDFEVGTLEFRDKEHPDMYGYDFNDLSEILKRMEDTYMTEYDREVLFNEHIEDLRQRYDAEQTMGCDRRVRPVSAFHQKVGKVTDRKSKPEIWANSSQDRMTGSGKSGYIRLVESSAGESVCVVEAPPHKSQRTATPTAKPFLKAYSLCGFVRHKTRYV